MSSTILSMAAGLLGYLEAAAFVQARAAEFASQSLRWERLDLAFATGRVLAQPIHADRSMPPFPRSTRDGFACRVGEIMTGQWLTVAGSIRAGDPPTAPLPIGSVWEIMTGAAVPTSADAVVMLEHVEQGEGSIRLQAGRTLNEGENVVLAGAEARSGDELIAMGTRIGPSQIAAAATCGYAEVDVYAKPRVAILTTGDELVPLSEVPGPGQIRNSNAIMLASLVARAGGDPWILPSARDNAEAIETALRQALEADMILISGGVSAGKFDLVEPVLATLGARFHFTGVRIQPGKPLVFGDMASSDRSRGVPFFGLPGNPISSAATFLLFAAPILAALSGSTESAPRFIQANLKRKLKGKPNLTRFVPSACSFHFLPNAAPMVEAVHWQGSGDLAAFARANCFTVVPEGTDELRGGELAHILVF